MKRLLFTLTICLFCASLSAQNGLFFSADHLSSSMINAIAQDARGMLWVGTAHGLDRFDGYSFVNHSMLNPSDPRPTDVSSLLSTSDGHFWVGTSRGLFMYDEASDAYLPIAFPDSLQPRVGSLLQLSDGRLLAGTAGYGLYIIDATSMQALPTAGWAPSDDNSYFNNLFQSSTGKLWKAGADERIVRCDEQGKASTMLSAQGGIVAFCERKGVTYALCQHGFMALEGQATRCFESDALPAHFTTAIADAQGNIYIGSRTEGLFWLPAGEQTIRRLPVLTIGVDVSRASIEALFLDRRGNLWVGCQQKGLLMIPLHRQPLFRTWSFSAQHIQTTTSVAAIVPGSDAVTWCAVPGDGVYGFDESGFVVSHPQSPKDIETLMRDGEGTYWLGSTNDLFRYDPSQGAYEQTAHLPGTRVNQITDLGDGLLAVSAFGAGLNIVDKRTGNIVRHLTMHDTDTTGRGRLVNDWIHCMDIDRHGRLWLGTASGICCYDAAKNTFRPDGIEAFAENEACQSLRVLTSGELALGLERGLCRWTPKGGLSTEECAEAMRGRSISYITEDRHHDLWLSTNDGLWRWSPTAKTLVSYVGAGGLQAREFVPGAGLQTADGHILLGTSDGVTVFSPDSLHATSSGTESVQLTALVVGGQHANATTRSNGRKIMNEALLDSHHFRLSYIDATFQLEFSLLHFDDAADVTFEYRLADENRWHILGRGQNAIAFNHLEAGEYELEVRARQAGIVTASSNYTIEVLPPWWRSPLAFWIYAMFFVTGLFVAIKLYNRHVQQLHDQEKLHLLMSAMNADDTPLTLDEMKRAINSFVQSRKRKRGIYGDVEAVADQMGLPEQRGNDELLMDRIMQSVNRHLGDSDFTVEQLCSEAAISRAHLHRKMKEMTGMSVTEFIRDIRLEQAARLLREQKLNITQVAYSVGFSSLGYFATVFRKHFGVAPRDYMAQCRPS